MPYRVLMNYPDGSSEYDENIFETESDAEEHGAYLCSCYRQGGEDLMRSNPGDYEEDDGDADYEVEEV